MSTARVLQFAVDLRIYVSDTGWLVIEQGDNRIALSPDEAPDIVSGLRALLPCAKAKEQAHLEAIDAEYQVFKRRGGRA